MNKNKQTGFTLIEIMIVVVIVAIMTGAAVMSFPRDTSDLLKEEVDRIHALLSLSQDEAILQSRELAIGFNQSGYTFFTLDNNAWSVYDDDVFKARRLPADLLSQLYLEGIPIVLEKKLVKPQVFILSSGEMTPFVYELQFPGKDEKIKLVVNAIGDENIVEVVRTGVSGISRGERALKV